jgi:hypothetical protein
MSGGDVKSKLLGSVLVIPGATDREKLARLGLFILILRKLAPLGFPIAIFAPLNVEGKTRRNGS